MKKLMMLSTVAMFTLAIGVTSSGTAWANHGDCLNTPGQNTNDVNVPEAAGSGPIETSSGDLRLGGIGVAAATGKARVSASFGPCAGSTPNFPPIEDIPGQLPGGGPS